jgi:hypothetical protein
MGDKTKVKPNATPTRDKLNARQNICKENRGNAHANQYHARGDCLGLHNGTNAVSGVVMGNDCVHTIEVFEGTIT